ncbi:hypothetical protein [Chryseobacterium sp. MFBS3-17]|uniref:DUF7935 family protein n=1 Tax=Chryseobacterium sp. MFBS3-17 TaxID=2886689 RepID=UPI001D0DD24A|nr:hypothetical protein [Chryseobacterium sp. MFBS3-17]MCC2591685.1 hypothetical protein [Chryseobacterium sp. MFBS3-17]
MFNIDRYISSPLFPYFFALILAIPFLVLFRQFVFQYIKMKNKELKMLSVKGNSENKSQAYERMVLFLERLKPANLVNKFDKDLAKHEYVYLLEKSINEEFDYNSSQQLYITRNTWQDIVNAKAALLKILMDTYENVGDGATLSDFKTVFLMNYMNGDDFIAQTIEQLRREVLLVT